MKKVFLICMTVSIAAAMYGQKKLPAKPKSQQSVSSSLKTLNDSASYAIGISVANFYKVQGMERLNVSLVSKAISDVFANRKTLIDEMQCNDVIMHAINKKQENKAATAIMEGEKFLAENKQRPGVKTTPSGLQYEIIQEGNGPKPGPTDSVVCHYKATLVNGTEFENSYHRGEPITFTVNGVIKGWTEALQLMSVGSKYKLFIPYQLGYGVADYGPIPGGSVLIFELELLGIKGK